MPEAFVKALCSTFELRQALSTAFQASVHHHPQPSLPLPAEKILGLSKPDEQRFYEEGRAAVREEVGWWMSEKLELGAHDLFRKTGADVVNECIGNIVTRLSECRLKTQSVNLRTRSLFVHVGRGDLEYRRAIFRPILYLYLDEFPHIFKRWRPVPDDFDGSPQSAIRRTEGFRILAFRRETLSRTDGAVLVVRRSQRLASRPVKASSTAAPQGIFFRRIGELPVTPTKGRKKAAQDALEHPAKRRRLADVSNLLTPSQSISMASLKASQKPASDESISAAPFKVVKARGRARESNDSSESLMKTLFLTEPVLVRKPEVAGVILILVSVRFTGTLLVGGEG